MDACNLAVLRGVVTRHPVRRELPAGVGGTNHEVTTPRASLTASGPVAVRDRPVPVGAGDEVVVIGTVERRFFRAGGVTQSRTEVVAARVVPARRVRTAERAIEAAVNLIAC